MIPDWWPAIVFGLPVLLLSLAVSATGIALRLAWLPFIGAALAIPSALYLGAQPALWPAGLVLPGLHLLVAVAVRRGRSMVAAGLLLPNVASAVLLGSLLVRQLFQ